MLETEIQPEISQKRKKIFINTGRYGYTPAAKGDIVHDIRFDCNHIKGMNMQFGCPTPKGYVSISEILLSHQSITLLFYSATRYEPAFIAEMESLAKDTEVMGGKMILITHLFYDEIMKTLGKNHTLTVYQDIQMELSTGFGLYQKQNPLADWLSGIENDEISLPGLFVINNQKEIIFNKIDYDFSMFEVSKVYNQNLIRKMLSIVFHENRNKTLLN